VRGWGVGGGGGGHGSYVDVNDAGISCSTVKSTVKSTGAVPISVSSGQGTRVACTCDCCACEVRHTTCGDREGGGGGRRGGGGMEWYG
jgi:hypothetical protein